jgi:hypothetical protein
MENGLIAGLLFPALPTESARAFSYDYGSVWYREQIINLEDFPELAEMPFFTIESCYYFESYFKEPKCESLQPMLGAYCKFVAYSPNQNVISGGDQAIWHHEFPNPNGLWTMPIFDLWVNEQGCFTCNRDGWIIGINHQGEMIQQYRLSQSTRCLGSHAETIYVACDDGQIYEFTGKVPEGVYNLKLPNTYFYTYQIYALKKTTKFWFITDAHGKFTCTDLDWQTQWQIEQPAYWLPYLLCVDETAVYQGYYSGLICSEQATGKTLWQQKTDAPILCGDLLGNNLFFGCSDRHIYALSTEQPESVKQIFTTAGIPYALILSPDGKYIIIADYDRQIYIINQQGNLQATITLEKGAAMAMKLWGDRLYVGTTQGMIVCFPLDLQSLQTDQPSDTTATKQKVKLHCIKIGSKLKVRPLAAGYQQNWNVHFPQHLRKEGAIYFVDDLRADKQGKFYRIVGQILEQDI